MALEEQNIDSEILKLEDARIGCIDFLAFKESKNESTPKHIIAFIEEIDEKLAELNVQKKLAKTREVILTHSDFFASLAKPYPQRIVIEIGATELGGALPKFKVRVSDIRRDEPHTKEPDTVLSVLIMDNGKRIFKQEAYETFIECLEEFGEKNVLELNYLIYGYPIISDKYYDKIHENYARHRTKSGYYVITHSSTIDKKEDLKKIAAMLGRKIEVNILPK